MDNLQGLKKSAVAGVRWSSLSMAGCTVLETTRLIVLGRLLPPDAFGIMAMLLVIIGFGQIFSQMGLVQSVIQRPEPKAFELASLYWLNLTAGLFVYFLLLLATPWVIQLYDTPALRELIPWVGLFFILNPLGDLYRAMLEKTFQFKQVACADLIGTSLGVTMSIALALNDFGIWSLVWGQLTTAGFRNLGFFLFGQKLFRPILHFAKEDLRGYLRFGIHETGAMTLNYLNSRIDQLLIGAILGPQALGYYSMAFNLVLRPVQMINPVLTRVAFPTLSQFSKDNEKLKRGYLKMLNILTAVNAPVLIGIAAIAPIVIPVVLGPKWKAITPVLQILSFYALLRSIGNAGGSMILAKGRADISLYWNSVLFIFTPISITLAAYFGDIKTVALTLMFLQIFFLFLWYKLIIKYFFNACLKEFLYSIGEPIIIGILMGLSIYTIEMFFIFDASFFSISILILVGIFTYMLFYYFINKHSLLDNLGLFFKGK